MDTMGISFLVPYGTWLRTQQFFYHPAVGNVRVPWPDSPGGRGTSGIMVIMNLRLATAYDFNWLEVDHYSQAYVWFRLKSIVVDGFYLPPHMPLYVCMYKIISVENYVLRSGFTSQIFLVGNMNMWLDVQEGDTMSYSRAPLDTIMHQIGLEWLKLINTSIYSSHTLGGLPSIILTVIAQLTDLTQKYNYIQTCE